LSFSLAETARCIRLSAGVFMYGAQALGYRVGKNTINFSGISP